MAEPSIDPKLQERIAQVDSELPSPEIRAQVVWELLKKNGPDLTDWDVLCFASAYIGWQSQNFTWLEKEARELNRLMYTAHYIATNQDLSTGLKKDGTESNTSRKPVAGSTGFTVEGGGFE